MRKAFGKEPVLQEPMRSHNFPDFPDDTSVVRGADAAVGAAFKRMAAVGQEGPSESDRIRQTAEMEKKQAYEAGLAKGLEKGKAAAVGELDAALGRLREAYMNIEKYRRELYLQAETDTVGLALAVARKIVGQEVALDQEVVLNVVKGALEKVIDHEKVKVRVNPLDLEIVKTALFQFSPLVENLENICFEADAAVTAGGCIVETNFGNIDARLENQLEHIDIAFTAELEKAKYKK